MDFEPQANDEIYLFGEQYIFQKGLYAFKNEAYAATGGQGTVFRLHHIVSKQDFALKVFKKQYRNKDLVKSLKHLEQIEAFEGMRAAKRNIILPNEEIIKKHKDLEYAMLIPWIVGKTWSDIMTEAQELAETKEQPYYQTEDAINLCKEFLRIMVCLNEEKKIAHTDISPGNVVIDRPHLKIELLDLEDIYISNTQRPKYESAGTEGYRHPTAQTFWCLEGDRYAAAVLAAEILILANKDLSKKVSGDGFFGGNRLSDESKERFEEASAWLKKVAPHFAEVFERFWISDSLIDCPLLSELHAAILTTQTENDDDIFTGIPIGCPILNDQRSNNKNPKPIENDDDIFNIPIENTILITDQKSNNKNPKPIENDDDIFNIPIENTIFITSPPDIKSQTQQKPISTKAGSEKSTVPDKEPEMFMLIDKGDQSQKLIKRTRRTAFALAVVIISIIITILLLVAKHG